jgi:cellulose synthase/poly-beta-1,6-N-acetylglucosamine synthase-like glycosyltransferase
VLFQLFAIAALVFSLLYIFFIFLYLRNWEKLPFFPLNTEGVLGGTKISVLIPVRNEQATILPCLQSILAGSYPKNWYEIIVIDDHSDDLTPQYIADFATKNPNVRLIELKNYLKLGENQPFKKRAIEAAIGEATGDLIVTTDGDCIVPPHWLRLIATFREQTGKRFIAAPVNFFEEKSAFERFQSLDYLGMMGVTGAGVQGKFTHMCNGANLAYDKTLFHTVGGFRGVDHVASGDDMLLMQKIAHSHPDDLGFLKNPAATVHTHAKPTVADFLSQRRRWASKSSSYTEFFAVFQLAFIFFFCWNIVLSFCLSIVYDASFFWLFLAQFAVKTFCDFNLLMRMVRFFDRFDLVRWSLVPQILHILYIVVVGTLANLRKTYVWKGRTVR